MEELYFPSRVYEARSNIEYVILINYLLTDVSEKNRTTQFFTILFDVSLINPTQERLGSYLYIYTHSS